MVGKIGGGLPGIDPRSLQELEELKEELAQQAARNMDTTQAAAPPQIAALKKGDRAGAAGMMRANAPRVEMPQSNPQDLALEKELTEKLQALGYLPKDGNVSRAQLEQATQKFIKDHRGLADVNSVEDLFALIDMMIARDNSRRNASPAPWNGQSRAQRSGMLPSQGPSASQGPAPNSAALRENAARAIATAQPPPPAGSINAKIAQAAQSYMGTSTAAGPDGGNLACAWSVNKILERAGVKPVGSNTNYVPSVEQALQGGRGEAIAHKDLKPGDIVVWGHGHHIGIYMGDGKVANNSSSRAAFVNMSQLQSDMRAYRVTN